MELIKHVSEVDKLSYKETCFQLKIWNWYCSNCTNKACNDCQYNVVIIELEAHQKGLRINSAYYQHDVLQGVYD